MDKIINILLLVIIFVFDPLAISLVIAANFAFDKANRKNLYGELEDDLEPNVWDELDNDSYTEDQVEKEIDPKDIEVADPEVVVVEEEWKTLNEDDTELKESKIKKVARVLQKAPSQRRVEFTDGSTGWVDKGDENKITYL